ncbi:MAG: alpha/beta hydrolase [Desulfobacteraceae bacterium]|nr:alpha/beta hydrolase [Desulfobacteraceae bacterium]
MKYILPGMGANSKMYSGPWHELEDCCFIDWPPYNQERSIADTARKLIEKYQINQNDIVIGSSLGGMAGLEIAYILGLKQVFLIGSAISPNEISFL